jgi:mannose-1-phosphate guanylyltransferase
MPDVPDVIVLCGGAGLRLRSVIGKAPKGMAAIGGRPFLELLLRQARCYGFARAILAVGYQKDAIQSHFGNQSCGLDLIHSPEEWPLGTGGALRQAASLAKSASILVMNGDSYTDADLGQFLDDYRASGADASVVIVAVDGRDDCGTVSVDRDGRLDAFAEKQRAAGTNYVNAGIYLLSRQLVDGIPASREISLEKELFPKWIEEGRNIRGFIWPGTCVDIGTPDRYRAAQQLLGSIEAGTDTPQRRAPQ